MKYIKLFEEFSKDYMKKIDLKDFKKIKKGTKLMYMGGKVEVLDNNGYVLKLKGEDGRIFSVNKSQFDHGGMTMRESVNELRTSPVSGTMAGSIESLEDRKYELKKDVKGAQIGDFTNVTLPKGTIIYNLPGGVFADHFSLKNKYSSRSSRGPQYFEKPTFSGISIRQMPDILAAIEKNSKVLESVNEKLSPSDFNTVDGLLNDVSDYLGDTLPHDEWMSMDWEEKSDAVNNAMSKVSDRHMKDKKLTNLVNRKTDDIISYFVGSLSESVVTEAKGGQIMTGDYVKTQYGDIYLRVDGKVGKADAYVRVIKGKAGKRKTGLHDSMKLTLVNKDGLEESVVTEARAYNLKASEFGGDTFSAAYNVKGEPTWRVHSTYAIDQVSGENNPDERDVVFFEVMPVNNEIIIKIGGINNLKRTGATVGNNFGATIEEWKNDPEGIAKNASKFLTDATHLKWLNKKARSQGQKIKWALKDDYSSVIKDLVNKALGLKESSAKDGGDKSNGNSHHDDHSDNTIAQHWKDTYGEEFHSKYPAVAKIIKQRNIKDKRELKRIWDETYGENFEEQYPALYNKLD